MEENFQIPGKYKIAFHYSTKSTKLDDYLGDGDNGTELRKLFGKVPHIELKSNTIEIEIKYGHGKRSWLTTQLE